MKKLLLELWAYFRSLGRKLWRDVGVYVRSLRRNRPAGRFKGLHPRRLRASLQSFYSRGGSFSLIGLALLVAVGCFLIYVVIQASGKASLANAQAPSAGAATLTGDSQSPLGIILSAFKSEEQKEKDRVAIETRAQRELRKKLENVCASMQSRFQTVDKDQSEFLRKAQQLIGASLDADPVPDDLAWVVTLQPTAAQAWTEIQRDRISSAEIQNISSQLNDITVRVRTWEFVDDDIDRLKDLDSTLSKLESRQADADSALTHIGVLLEARRYQTHVALKGT